MTLFTVSKCPYIIFVTRLCQIAFLHLAAGRIEDCSLNDLLVLAKLRRLHAQTCIAFRIFHAVSRLTHTLLCLVQQTTHSLNHLLLLSICHGSTRWL